WQEVFRKKLHRELWKEILFQVTLLSTVSRAPLTASFGLTLLTVRYFLWQHRVLEESVSLPFLRWDVSTATYWWKRIIHITEPLLSDTTEKHYMKYSNISA